MSAGNPAGNTVAVPAPKAVIGAIDPILAGLLTSLQQQAATEQAARLNGTQAIWMMPPLNGWSGSMTDYDSMEKPFDRSSSNDSFKQATADPSQPGTTGDMVVATTQIDYLAIAERSFRMRHTMTRSRAMCHAMTRKNGHGNERGPLLQCVQEYLNGAIKASKQGG
jgi:hypothetical protein